MSVRRGLSIFGLGIAIIVIALVALSAESASSFAADDFDVPGTFSQDLAAGQWVLFERVDETVTAQVTQVQVTAPDGTLLDVRPNGPFSQFVETEGARYDDVSRFDVASAGTYEIEVSASEPSTVRVGPRVNPLLVVSVLAVALLGAVLILAGLAMVGVVWAFKSLEAQTEPQIEPETEPQTNETLAQLHEALETAPLPHDAT